MAKIKQPSKISKLTAEVRLKNESQETINASVNQRIRDLEEIAADIVTAMKGITSHLVALDTSGVGPVGGTNKLKKDETKEEDQGNILQKLYNFMVTSAEKREKKKQLLKAKKKQERTQKIMRMKKAFKSNIRNKLTPTTGGIFKTMGLGFMGAAIGGLVWVFQDELKKYALSVKNSVLDFKGFLVDKFKIISGFFNFLKDKLQPITSWINRKAEGFAQSFMNVDTSQGVYEGIKKWVVDFVSDFIGKSTDAITGWLYDIGKGISEWLTKPLSWENYGKLMSTIATRMMAGPFAAAGVALAGPVSGGITSTKTYFNKAEYGEDFVNKVREIVDMNPDYKKMDEESKQDIVNNIIEQIQTGEPPKDLLGITKVGKKEVFGKSSGMVLGDVYKERKSKQDELYSSLVGQQKEIKKTRMAEYGYSYVGPTSPDMPDAGYFTGPSGDKVSMDDVNKKLIQLSLKKEILDRATSNISDINDKYLKPALQPLMQAYEDVGNEVKRVKNELNEADKRYGVSETAIKSFDTAKETVTEARTAIREELADDTTFTDSAVSAFSLAETGLDKTFETTAKLANKGMEKIQPTLDRISKMDIQKEALDSYSTLQKTWSKVNETYQNLADPAKFEAFMDKLQGEEQTPNKLSATEPSKPDIQADPNENLLVKQLMEQVNQTVVANQSVTNTKSTSEDVHYESPLSRNANPSIRKSMMNNTSPWDIPFSIAR
jgi:uncharacterized protein YukE